MDVGYSVNFTCLEQQKLTKGEEIAPTSVRLGLSKEKPDSVSFFFPLSTSARLYDFGEAQL